MNNGNGSHVPERIKELREILGVSALDIAKDTGLSFDVYRKYESGELDIPISVLYTIANRLGTDVTVLLTGEEARMDSAAVCRKGKGVQIERYPGYEYSSLRLTLNTERWNHCSYSSIHQNRRLLPSLIQDRSLILSLKGR